MNILTLENLIKQQSISNQRVLIRADLNVPQHSNGDISDDTRIRASLPAIQMCLKAGARVSITSHLGRPMEGVPTDADSLAPVAKRMEQLLGHPVCLVKNWVDGIAADLQNANKNPVLLLENCRLNVGEKKNDAGLAQKMAQLCDVFVFDAFATAHRAEATTAGISQYASVACAGPLVAKEIEALSAALKAPKRPLVAIVGGSKVSSKLTILESLADQVDVLIVGGGIANTFMKAAGLNIGKSLVEADLIADAQRVMAKMKARGANVPIPTDVKVGKRFDANEPAVYKRVEDIADDDMIFDIGEQTSWHLDQILNQASTIVWNGPLGVFEFDQFAAGTEHLTKTIANSAAFTLAGGGDTIAAIEKFGVANKLDYISTAGGAFLEFLEGKALPAIEALVVSYAKHTQKAQA